MPSDKGCEGVRANSQSLTEQKRPREQQTAAGDHSGIESITGMRNSGSDRQEVNGWRTSPMSLAMVVSLPFPAIFLCLPLQEDVDISSCQA